MVMSGWSVHLTTLLLLQPVVRASTSSLPAKIGQVVRYMHVEHTFFGGHKHSAKHAARKLAGQFFAKTCLRQLERLEQARSTQDKSTE